MRAMAARGLSVLLLLVATGCAGPGEEGFGPYSAPSSRSRVREKVSARPPPVGSAVVSASVRRLPESRKPSAEEWLQTFLDSTSLPGFIEPQRKVDMPRLLESLDPWDAARLGARGPLRTGRDILNRKRAEAIVDFSLHWTPGRAGVFTLFILDTAFKSDAQDVLRRLGDNKRLGATVFQMPDVRKALQRRGIRLADYADRPERLSDGLRGLGQGLEYFLDSSPLSNGAAFMYYQGCKGQLPAAYQRLLDYVEAAEVQAWLSEKHVLLGGFDTLTFGVPLGLYGLVAGTGQGLYHLAQGQYESAGQELTGATLVVLAYAEARSFDSTPAAPLAERAPAFDSVARGAERPRPGVAQLWEAQLWERVQRGEPPGSPLGQLGEGELRQLASYLKNDPDAALFVYDNGEAGALALARARGNLARAQALLPKVQQPLAMASGDTGRDASSARPQTPTPASRPPRPPSSAPQRPAQEDGRANAGAAMPQPFTPEQVSTPDEVLDRKISEFDAYEPGERMTGDLEALAKKRPVLEEPPPDAAANDEAWRKYVDYWNGRFAELVEEQKAPVPPEEPAFQPRTWQSFKRFYENILKGRQAENRIAAALQRQALRPPEQRGELSDLNVPQVERHVGVSRGKGTKPRYPDVVAYDKSPRPGQPARWVTFSIKWRALKGLGAEELRGVLKRDAKYAHDYYGGELEMRRRSLDTFGKKIRVDKVYLIYDIEQMPNAISLNPIIDEIRKDFGVEVLFQ